MHYTKNAASTNLEAAHQFLKALDEDADAFGFRVIYPNGKAKNFDGSLDQFAPTLERNNRQGAGIYVVVNAGGHQDPDIDRIRSVFVDLDRAPLEPIYKCPLEPHLIVCTSPGKYHVYWLVDSSTPLPPEQFRGVQRTIVNRFNGDPTARNPSRVLRLPGFCNHKYGEPQRVEIIGHAGGLPYTTGTILEEFPPTEGVERGSAGEGSSRVDPEAILAGVSEGERDDKLFRYACRLRRQGLKEVEAMRLVLDAASNCDPPFDEAEAQKKVESAWRYSEGGEPGEGESDAAESARPAIYTAGGALHRLVEEADRVLADSGEVFQRGTQLVRIVETEKKDQGDGLTRPVGTPLLSEPGSGWIEKKLTEKACWLRFDKRIHDWVAIDAPSHVARTLKESAGEWTAPLLRGITEAPTLRPDGSLLAESGYDLDSQLYVSHDLPPLAVRERPSKEAAEQALDDLRSLLIGFPFEDPADEAVAVAGMLTAIIRPSLPTAPLIAFSAPERGSGKSTLVKICSTLATGGNPPALDVSEAGEETEKRLNALLVAGDRIVSLDNVETPLGSSLLCQALTEEQLGIRILGRTEIQRVPAIAAFFVTGNNVRLRGDLCRRSLLCTLDPGMEHPESREFPFDPLEEVAANRERYLAAALTILRAHIVAELPGKEGLAPFGSFSRWSDWIRGALVWLGMADPLTTINKVQDNDPIKENLADVLTVWHEVFGDEAVTLKALVTEAEPSVSGIMEDSANERLRDALFGVAEDRGRINKRKLGWWLRKHQGRVVGGLALQEAGKDSRQKVALWQVTKTSRGFRGFRGFSPTHAGKCHKRESFTETYGGLGEKNPQNPENPAVPQRGSYRWPADHFPPPRASAAGAGREPGEDDDAEEEQ